MVPQRRELDILDLRKKDRPCHAACLLGEGEPQSMTRFVIWVNEQMVNSIH
jgi:hypothetical protein